MQMDLNYFRVSIHARNNKEFLFPTLRICRILSGEFLWQIGQNALPVKSGDIVLLNNLVPRKIINTNALALNIEVFEFSPACILNRKLLSEMFYNVMPTVVSFKMQKLIDAQLSVVADTYKAIPSVGITDHMLQAVFDLLEHDTHHCLSTSKSSAIVLKAVAFIWEHYYEDISVPYVAKHLNISKNHLEKLFKDMHGIGVGAYIRIIRVYKVISLLEKHPDASVLNIAFSCGFNSSSGFYKAYKDVTGRNPRRSKGEPM